MEQEHHTSGVKSSSYLWDQISLVQMEMDYCCSVVSDSLRPRGLQHARPPVPHHLPESAQVHVHCISDAIQPSHPLTLSSPSALNLSQHQGLFQWDGITSDDQNTGVSASASILPTSIQGWFPLRLAGLILPSKGLSGVFSSTTVRRY